MRRRIRKKNEESEINITPMLDIVFIMLIFFIVTTSFFKEISIDVNRPTKSPDAVRANIESNLALKPQASVVVVSDRDADAGLLVKVIDQSRLAGASNVSLAAQK